MTCTVESTRYSIPRYSSTKYSTGDEYKTSKSRYLIIRLFLLGMLASYLLTGLLLPSHHHLALLGPAGQGHQVHPLVCVCCTAIYLVALVHKTSLV
jgi:hypothetical protein